MYTKEQFLGKWMTWTDEFRFDQELFRNGRFKATISDEDGKRLAWAKGTWELNGNSMHWRYTWSGLPLPRGYDKDKLVRAGDDFFILKARDRHLYPWYRPIQIDESSGNIDMEELRPLLSRVSARTTTGFKRNEITAVMRKVRKLKPEKSCRFTFAVRVNGHTCPLHIWVFMDDIQAPDLYFWAPRGLARHINREFKRLDAERK